MSSPKTYLITGANRGIGKGFTTTFLQRPSTTVIATVRDTSHPTAKELAALPKAENSRLILVTLDSSNIDLVHKAIETLKKDYQINHIDVVIANAGIAMGGATVRATTPENIKDHVLVNAIGPVALFQDTVDLLQASSTKQPIFVAISTLVGSMGSMEMLAGFPASHSPYGGSKAALNWFIRRLHFEEPWLTSFVFHPGLVETDLAKAAVAKEGISLKDIGAISVETSVAGMIGVIDAATKETSGTFRNYDGSALPW